MKISHSKKFFNLLIKKIKIEIHPKMIMTWTYENMDHFRLFKVHNFFFIKFVLAIILQYVIFFNISYIESL